MICHPTWASTEPCSDLLCPVSDLVFRVVPRRVQHRGAARGAGQHQVEPVGAGVPADGGH